MVIGESHRGLACDSHVVDQNKWYMFSYFLVYFYIDMIQDCPI